MTDISGPMLLEDHIAKILFCRKRIEILQSRLQNCEKDQIPILKERIRYYQGVASDSKKAVKYAFNCTAMSRSFLDFVPDEYYLALIDREGCVKGVIL